ncbi:MAG TPA: cbb3-type cytochrome c oxidase subunit 3 [Hyphomicrobiaceae bacterium]|nr:cbb3-type cytochrome c oxidase subunit 3 [Hyphomicrobiaceae bacterium]
MTAPGHETLVALAKSWGLFYLIALSIGVLAYTFWPGSGKRFEHAANSIADDENGPCV